MYVKFRYLALSALLLGLMAHGSAYAQSHTGSTSQAQGVIYKCPNNHTVDVFGDEDALLGMSASVDNTASMPLINQIHIDGNKYVVEDTALIFGKQADKHGLIIGQTASRTGPKGDHGVDISYIKNGVEVWHYASCFAE